jgi:hypothetical protein
MPTLMNAAQAAAARRLNSGTPVEALIGADCRIYLTTRLDYSTGCETSHYVWEADRWVAIL